MYLVSVGFDYVVVGLEYVFYCDCGCIDFVYVCDDEVLEMF